MSLFPVYRNIAEHLQEDPERAQKIDMDQLKTLLQLSEGAPGALLDGVTFNRVKEIYDSRLPRLRVKAIARAKVQAKAKPKAKAIARPRGPKGPKAPEPLEVEQTEPAVRAEAKTEAKAKAVAKPRSRARSVPQVSIDKLMQDHRSALDMSQQELRAFLEWSDQEYYVKGSEDVVPDKIYDYVKGLYNQREHQTNDPDIKALSVSSKTGVGAASRERDTKLPIPMYSLANMNKGEGEVAPWASKNSGAGFLLSAKMDGMSALYHNGKLYTRGDATTGKDITHVLHYIPLPKVPPGYSVRGELVMNDHIFTEKYKGKKGNKGSSGVRKVNRNSVAGAVSTINHVDPEFLKDMEFVTYELIKHGNAMQLSPSDQFAWLEEHGFTVAAHTAVERIDDEVLSTYYHELLEGYPFMVDGIVVARDAPYKRETKKNPEYARSFKELLASDIKITKVTRVEWRPTQYGYLQPRIWYEPVVIGGVTQEKATGHNAKHVINTGMGPGAVVEVVRWNEVNPRVHRVITPAEVPMPGIPYVWVKSPSGEDCDIKMAGARVQEIEDEEALEAYHMSQVRKIHQFLKDIGVKNFGEKTVQRIYDAGVATDIGGFVNLTPQDIAFLGPSLPKKHVDAINVALHNATFPVLMGASKIFGRGLSLKKFSKVFQDDAVLDGDFFTGPMSREEYVALFRSTEGFGAKTSEQAAAGMAEFWDFMNESIPEELHPVIAVNTVDQFSSKPQQGEKHPDIDGKSFYLTGGSNPEITEFIKNNGGTVRSGMSKSLDMLIVKNHNISNNKTKVATENGIPILDWSEFRESFLEG